MEEDGRNPKVMLMAPTYERITPVAEPPIGRGARWSEVWTTEAVFSEEHLVAHKYTRQMFIGDVYFLTLFYMGGKNYPEPLNSL